jgi:hypothetical protein
MEQVQTMQAYWEAALERLDRYLRSSHPHHPADGDPR